MLGCDARLVRAPLIDGVLHARETRGQLVGEVSQAGAEDARGVRRSNWLVETDGELPTRKRLLQRLGELFEAIREARVHARIVLLLRCTQPLEHPHRSNALAARERWQLALDPLDVHLRIASRARGPR